MIRIQLIGIFLFITSVINAQILTGTIKNTKTGLPMPDASVVILKSGIVTVSDTNGVYRFKKAPAGKINVKVSFVGYASLQKQVTLVSGKTSVLNFNLSPVTYNQDQIVVTANKVGIDRDNAPLNVTVITQKEIEQSGETNIMPIISSKVPGLFVTQRGVTGFSLSQGAAGQISIRGVGGDGNSFPVLVLIDGEPQFMGIFGHPIPDSYVSSDIEKVEIIKGPASVLYGTNAMGGVINLITREAKKPGLSLNGRLMYGSFNTQKYTAAGGYRTDGFSITGSFNHDQTDGHRPNSGFNINNGYFKLSYEPGRHFTITADGNSSVFHAYDPGSIYYDNPSEYNNNSHWVDIKRTNGYLTLTNKFNKIEGGIKAYYTHGNHNLYDGWISVDENIGLSFYQGLRLFRNDLISFGLDLQKYGGRGITQDLGDLSGKWVDVHETGLYLIAQHRFFEKLTLNSGVRLEHHSLFGDEWVPQFGFEYNLLHNTRIKASASKGFRSPSIRELYLFPVANPALQPETMWNYETTLIRDFASGKGTAQVTVFYAHGDNLILTIPNPSPPPPAKNENSGSFSHKGLEAELDFHLRKNLSLNSSYSFLHMDTPKVSAPKHQLYVGTDYTQGKFDVNIHVNYIGKLYTNTNPMAIQNFILLNSKINFRLNKHMLLFVYGENLLDVNYQMEYGYPMPGITIFTGLNLKI